MTKNNELSSFVQRNANVITVIVTVGIILIGGSFASGSGAWLYTMGAVGAIGLLVLIYLNFKSVIKAALAIFVLLYTMSTMIRFSVILSDEKLLAYATLQQLCLFLLLLLFSYFISGIRSRWTAVGLATLVNFSIILQYNTALGFASGAAIGSIVFFLHFKYLKNPFSLRNSTPELVDNENIDKRIHEIALLEGWNVKKRTKRLFRRKYVPDYLVWNDTNAFLLIPIRLNEELKAIEGRRGAKLTYMGNPVNKWLVGLTGPRIPLWTARYASVMVVLLDTDNTNGTEAKTIGVSLPDTMRKLPVGIYPAKKMFGSAKKVKTLSHLSEVYGPFTKSLSTKQYKALNASFGGFAVEVERNGKENG